MEIREELEQIKINHLQNISSDQGPEINLLKKENLCKEIPKNEEEKHKMDAKENNLPNLNEELKFEKDIEFHGSQLKSK